MIIEVNKYYQIKSRTPTSSQIISWGNRNTLNFALLEQHYPTWKELNDTLVQVVGAACPQLWLVRSVDYNFRFIINEWVLNTLTLETTCESCDLSFDLDAPDQKESGMDCDGDGVWLCADCMKWAMEDMPCVCSSADLFAQGCKCGHVETVG